MRIGSLFSGIGGLELGLEWAGVGHTVWQVEINPFCRSILSHEFPHADQWADVRDVGGDTLAPVDVLCGGYPCQPYSTAGRRKGRDDARDLWPEFRRIIQEMDPRYVVLENTPGHLTLGFPEVLEDLAVLGYDAEWSILSACAMGAAHARERLFCVAYPAGLGQPEPWQYREDASDHETRDHWQADRLVDAVRRGALPFLCREDHGLPHRVDRWTAIGNAVVPQVARVVGQRLLAIDRDLAR